MGMYTGHWHQIFIESQMGIYKEFAQKWSIFHTFWGEPVRASRRTFDLLLQLHVVVVVLLKKI